MRGSRVFGVALMATTFAIGSALTPHVAFAAWSLSATGGHSAGHTATLSAPTGVGGSCTAGTKATVNLNWTANNTAYGTQRILENGAAVVTGLPASTASYTFTFTSAATTTYTIKVASDAGSNWVATSSSSLVFTTGSDKKC